MKKLRLLNNNISMRSPIVIAILGLLLVLSQSQTIHSFTFDSLRRHVPSYSLGYKLNGSTLQFNFTTSGTQFDFTGGFALNVESDEVPAIPVVCNIANGCGVGQNFCTMDCPLLISKRYRFNVTETDAPALVSGGSPNAMQCFLMDVGVYDTSLGGTSGVTLTPLMKHVETFRDKVSKLIFLNSSKNVNFSLYPATESSPGILDTGSNNIHLFRVNSVLDANTVHSISGSSELLESSAFTQNYDSANSLLEYTSNAPLATGFYVLVASYLTENVNFIKILFPSDPYACPCNPSYSDFHRNYQPCVASTTGGVTGNLPTSPGFPCISFDSSVAACIKCADGFILQNGSCKFNDTCPPGQFFKFGNCSLVPIENGCLAFDRFTGECLTCRVNGSTIVNGICIPPPVVCGANQFKRNNNCFDNIPFCITYDDNGVCTQCATSEYQVKNGVCALIPVICLANQYVDGRNCAEIPVNCIEFDVSAKKCLTCGRGFRPNAQGICEAIICGPRQVPSKIGFFCENVRIQCGEFDPLTGDCLTCAQLAATPINGRCRQVVSPLAGCQERQRLGFGECVNAEVNCASYNIQQQNCVKCISGYNFDYQGKCTLGDNKLCEADETLIQGYCIQKPPNCQIIDNLGLCSHCNVDYRNSYGQCVFVKNCGDRQYKSDAGSCVDLPAGCLVANPTSGVCLICIDETTAVGGICCGTGQYSFGGQCVTAATFDSARKAAESSLTPTCIGNHPTLLYCVLCNGNFLPNPFSPSGCA